ncbi:MAG: transposase [Actinomycetota bacterium]|nr:transposase [Actinomycetota bacterium]
MFATGLVDIRRAQLVDVGDVVVACWLAKENLREVYTVHGVDEGTVLLDAVIAECDEADIPELATLAKSLRSSRAEILNHHHTGDSNGPTEAMNLLVKKVRRVGHTFTSFKNYRIRPLLNYGVKWKAPRTASMRGRSPHVVA